MRYKELEDSILVFRCNRMLEGSWNSKDIDYMRITIVENFSIELLALLTLHLPKNWTRVSLQRAKRRVLSYLQKQSAGKFLINNRKWRGTTFHIETGNNIPESSQGILIVYKSDTLYGDKISEPNRIFLPIPPNEDFYINLNYKVPGENYWASVRVPIVTKKNV